MGEMLPVYKFRGKLWYRDARLSEYRNVNDPSDRCGIDDVDISEMEKQR